LTPLGVTEYEDLMKILRRGKDGGPLSTVTGYWLVELKKLFSVALLKFEDGSRDEYHSHAFASVSWVLSGRLREEHLGGGHQHHYPGLRPVTTRRSTFHRVFSEGTTWVLTLRGPWEPSWSEYDPATRTFTQLRSGRVVVGEKRA
jgi:hypothetical protein